MAFRQLARSLAIFSVVSGSSAAIAQPAAANVSSLAEDTFFSPSEAIETIEAVEAISPKAALKPHSDLPLPQTETFEAPTAPQTIIEPFHLTPTEPSFSQAIAFEPASFDLTVSDLTGPDSTGPNSTAPDSTPSASDTFEPDLANPLETAGDRFNEDPSGVRLSQNTPASELSEPERDLSPRPEAETSPVLPETEASEPPTTTPSNSTQVAVTEIQVVGSSVFSDRDFDPIVSPYEGRDLGLSELRQVANDITQLYLSSGYITSRAVLSEQTITDGVVQVRVIEGELEEIQVEGTRRLANYVRDRVNLANRKPLDQVALESQLQLLRADPLVDRIEASLRAGTGEGQSRLIVRVLEAPAFSGRAVVDTNSPPSVGIGRMGIEANYNNALGLGDRLSVSAFRSTAGGSNTYGVTYGVPLNAMNGTLQARYLPSSFNLIDPELAALGVEGSSSTYELTYRQPLIRKPNEELALSLGFRHRTGETLVSDIVIDSTRTSVFQFGQDYLKRDRAGAWGLRSQFNLGTGLLDATNRTDGEADGQFFSWLGQVQRAQVINRDNLLLIQGSLQLTPDSLLGADQFIIGGASSVRGYSQNARFGDNGFRASIEDRITVVRNEDDSPFTQIAPFLDTAAVWNQGDNTNDQTFLLGTGLGFILNPTEDIQARLDVGVPLIQLNEAGDSDQNAFFYFTMDYRF